MAKIVRAHGVVFKGRVDAVGGLSFEIAPTTVQGAGAPDDLDARLDEYGAS
ncbi:hypothetical protein [Altererythrobacter sp. B11]|uniref:hypothetical protein n=1 Tax=Altererythrobacter sp. B11 TaxID=2060312 RepID=UPI001559942D|nr:hypothetical protein [Altererythrobacter sp. B11]